MAKIPRSRRFAICIDSEGTDDLQVWKLYRLLPDADAASEGYVRVVDDSGEDYLYPATRFVFVDFPAAVKRKILTAATGA